MKMWLGLSAGLAAAIMLWSGTTLGQGKPAGCDKTSASEKVEGEVVSVEPDQGKLTLRAAGWNDPRVPGVEGNDSGLQGRGSKRSEAQTSERLL